AGDVTFTSVFKKKVTHTSRPQIPGGEPVGDPAIKAGEEWSVKPAKDVRQVPMHSRRLQLAKEAAGGKNAAFNRNIANRLWGVVMGKCLVDPPDMEHAKNPAAQPEVVEVLAGDFVATRVE